MRKYLGELHKKPDHHKRRFALLTSLSITVVIFAFWFFINFALNNDNPQVGDNNVSKGSLIGGATAAIKSITSQKAEVRGLEQVSR